MPVPSFEHVKSDSADQICAKIADRVRAERKRLGLSQAEFSERCGVALRTYKRFELNECDSLIAFIRIVAVFERVIALELLFPPKPLEAMHMVARLPTQ